MYPNLVLTLAVTLALPIAARAQAPGTLHPNEMAYRGIGSGASRPDVLAILGKPDSTFRTDPDDGGPTETWVYRHVQVVFALRGGLRRLAITDPDWSTLRMVMIGDHVDAVRYHYGDPVFGDSSGVVYARSASAFETQGMMFQLRGGHVIRIIIGQVIAVD